MVLRRGSIDIVESVLTLLAQSGLPSHFWDDSFVTTTFFITRVPSKTLSFSSPYEILYKTKPAYLALKPFRCLCYPHIKHLNKSKLDFRSNSAIFLGYIGSHKGYKALLKSGKLVITRDIIFHESIFPYLSSTHFTKPDSPTLHVPDFFSPPPLCPASVPSNIPYAPHHTPSPITASSSTLSQNSNFVPITPPLSQNSDSIPITPSVILSSSLLSLSDASPTPLDVSLNHHPMITMSKHDIFKPKILTADAYSKKDVDASSERDELCIVIPQSAKIALAIPV